MSGQTNDPLGGILGAHDAELEREAAALTADLTAADLTGEARPPQSDEAFAPGTVVRGKVANVASADVLIDLGGKMLGVVTRGEFEVAPQVGEELTLLVDGLDARGGLLTLSKKKAAAAEMWNTIHAGMVVEGRVTGMNKGGLEMEVHGVRGFIPASQVDTHFLKDISELIGQITRAEVTKFDKADQNLVLSRRKVLEREAEENRRTFLAQLVEGQTVAGKVRNLTEWGAFIELRPGVDGMIHVSDMSWGRVAKPSDVLQLGQEVQAAVLKINRETGKLSLGLKQIMSNPWDSVATRYAVQQKITGRVARLADFGAFVEIEPGIDGLIPISEMSWTRRVRHPKEIVNEGDVVETVILSIDPEKHRISLGLRQAVPNPWENITERYPADRKFPATVKRLAEFGAFVELEPGIEGLLHISEISEQRIRTVAEKLQPGQAIEVRVLKFDLEQRRISLSMKDPSVAPPPAPAAPEPARLARRKPEKPRRGGLEMDWLGGGLGTLDPSKYAR
ncbi:MAG: S1 RNA-binding domain-containing protein [Phycisphaerae bacterium]